MGLKKYEIITVGSDKRVRALRSWQVGDRYVNIGDVGGIVYDEKTLSQDGACWLFRGNFGFPGARIGGDSIVDVGEFTNANPKPNVTIDGASVLVGTSLVFNTDVAEAAGAVSAADFEQGGINFAIGQPLSRFASPNSISLKDPIFMGGNPMTINVDVPGFTVTARVYSRDGLGVGITSAVNTGEGVTISVPPGQYVYLSVSKNPVAAIVPADATTAAITLTRAFESSMNIRDSRLELNDTGMVSHPHVINPSGNMMGGVTDIVASTISLNKAGSVARTSYVVSKIYGSKVTADFGAGALSFVGTYNNVKNVTASGSLEYRALPQAYAIVQATDCDNFKYSPAVIIPSAVTAAVADNMPFIFQGCNVPGGRFYHHAQIANTYKNIDFALAQADLGKTDVNGFIMVSSEINGMYRLYSTAKSLFASMVESHESIKSLKLHGDVRAYGTTIYADAYFNGSFDFAGTNVFGHKVRSHPLAQVLNVQPRAVQGGFSLTAGSPPVPSVEATRVRTERYFRINGANGISIQNIPAGLEARIVYLDGVGRYVALGDWYTGSTIVPTIQLINTYAYLLFRKTGDAAITPEELAGVTVTVYNGCKIVNTGTTAVNMKGNIRVEDNATLVNASITGSGYFGGNAVMSGMDVNGYAYMKDNTLCTKTSENVQTFTSLIMEGNAVYNSIASLALTNLKLSMYDNSKVLGEFRNASVSVTMRDNATITAAGNLSGASTGTVTVQNDAVINTSITVVGDVTLRGSYVSTSGKTWAGKRVIDKHNAPEYDNNVKTQYDF